MKKFIILFFLILMILFLPSLSQALTNNTLAYSVSHTSSTSYNDLGVIGTKTVAQTILATADETWYGIGIYLDRIGLSSNTDSVYLRFRGNNLNICTTPDTSIAPKRKAYVKVSDIPDGDAAGNTMPPDSIGRGYLIWFIFDSPVSVTALNCYTIFLNAPKVDNSNRICWNSGTNGYADGSCYYATTNENSWTDYLSDLNFRVIKDKYALVAIRRLPFNLKGALTVSSSEIKHSVNYADSLHRWLNTNQNVGGFWGQGLNGNIGEYGVWFARGGSADSLGVYQKEIPYYFHGLDTTSNFYKDSVDNYVSRRWMPELETYADCDDGNPGCIDSTHIDKFLNYMLNRPSAFGKLYKGGIWEHSRYRRWGIPLSGGTTELGDSSGTVYHHAHKTFATGRFKFTWFAEYLSSDTTNWTQFVTYTNWQSLQDSLNVSSLPFTTKTLRDGVKTYRFPEVGISSRTDPHFVQKLFNLHVARQCVDSNWIDIAHVHLADDTTTTGGIIAADRDSIKAVHDNAASYGLWIPNKKQLFNQQAASAFAQITVDRPSGSKRRINIRSLYDWSWGSHVPDREEVYYLTFVAYAPESLIVTINGSDTLTDSNMTSQQDVPTDYNDVASGVNRNRAMSWVGMYNRTAGRKTVIYTPPSAPPSGKRNRTAVIEQLLGNIDKKSYMEVFK